MKALGFIVGLLVAALLWLAESLFVKFVWGLLMVTLFHLPAITLGQAFVICLCFDLVLRTAVGAFGSQLKAK